MNLLLRIILIAGLSVVSQTYFQWWTAVIISLLVELAIGKRNSTAFFSGFYGVAIPWMALATYIDIKSESILSVRILELFKLPQYSFLLIVLTGLTGGIMGGVGSLTGGWIKTAISNSDE